MGTLAKAPISAMSELLIVRVLTVSIATTGWKGKVKKPCPKIRTLTKGITTTRIESDHADRVRLSAVVETRQFKACLEGVLVKSTGTVAFQILEETFSSYLKKKRFRVVGYTLDTRITNVGKKPS